MMNSAEEDNDGLAAQTSPSSRKSRKKSRRNDQRGDSEDEFYSDDGGGDLDDLEYQPGAYRVLGLNSGIEQPVGGGEIVSSSDQNNNIG